MFELCYLLGKGNGNGGFLFQKNAFLDIKNEWVECNKNKLLKEVFINDKTQY